MTGHVLSVREAMPAPAFNLELAHLAQPSRRGFLAGSAALTALAAPATALAARVPAHDAGLLRTIAAYRRAQSVSDGWHEAVYDPARDAWQASLAAVPHHITGATYMSLSGRRLHMRTDRRTDVAIVESYLKDGRTYGNDDFGECCQELATALAVRNAESGRITADYLTKGVRDHSNRLGDHVFGLYSAIAAYPVHTVADLTLKLETLRTVDDDPFDSDQLMADLNRIIGRA